ncbi:MAG: hypothetical protein QNJ17_16720, partial [Desulfocapsaceae bacterium]|nr:hypothetical protein [Desulfocapsaceae bacterium]
RDNSSRVETRPDTSNHWWANIDEITLYATKPINFLSQVIFLKSIWKLPFIQALSHLIPLEISLSF